MEEPVAGKCTHRCQRSTEIQKLDSDINQEYKNILNLFRPVSFRPKWDYGIPNGITLSQYLNSISLDSWQNRIRYYRLLNNITASEVAKKIGMKSGISYMKKYENDCHQCYTTVENYYAVCDAIGISYKDIADDYMLFIASDYDVRLSNAIEKSGLSSREFAMKYDIEYTTLRHSLKRMHKLSIQTYEKYKKLFDELDV